MSRLYGVDILALWRSTAGLVNYLHELHKALSKLSQESIDQPQGLKQTALQLVAPKLLAHSDKDVRVLCTCCIVDILRVFAPEAPYNNDDTISAFKAINTVLKDLQNLHGSHQSILTSKTFYVLHSISSVQSCVIPAILSQNQVEQAEEVVEDMFVSLLQGVKIQHPLRVLEESTAVLQLCIAEFEGISEELLYQLLLPLLPERRETRQGPFIVAVETLQKTSEWVQQSVHCYLIKLLDISSSYHLPEVMMVNRVELLRVLYGVNPSFIVPVLIPHIVQLLPDVSVSELLQDLGVQDFSFPPPPMPELHNKKTIIKGGVAPTVESERLRRQAEELKAAMREYILSRAVSYEGPTVTAQTLSVKYRSNSVSTYHRRIVDLNLRERIDLKDDQIDSILLSTVRTRGRKRALTDEAKNELMTETVVRDLSKNSFKMKSFEDAMLEKRKSVAEERGLNANAVKPFSKPTARKYKQEIAPETQKDYKSQCERRLEALQDVCNHISLAALWPAVYEYCFSKTLCAGENIFNIDTMHMILQNSSDSEGKLLMAAGSKKELRRRQLNPASTTARVDTRKRRGVGVTPVLSAAGSLVSCVITIKDGSYSEVKVHKLPEFPNCVYRVHIICIPCPKRAKRKRASFPRTSSVPTSTPPPPLLSPSPENCFDAANHEFSEILLPFGQIDLCAMDFQACADDLMTADTPLGPVKAGPDEYDERDLLDEWDLDLDYDFDLIPPEEILPISAAPPVPATALSTPVFDESGELTTSEIMAAVAKETLMVALRACKKSVTAELAKHTKLSTMGPCRASQSTAGTDQEELNRLLQETRLLLTCDGEHFQLQALDVLKDLPQFSAFQFFKFCAQLSFVQQPADKTASFRVFKRLDKTAVWIETTNAPEPLYMRYVDEALRPIDPASRRTFRRFMLALPTYLHIAFSPKLIKAGFSDTGLVPFDSNKILQHWPMYTQISTNQSVNLLNTVKTLSNKVKEKGWGYILNSEIHKAIQNDVPASCLDNAGTNQVYAYALNRWGATWISNPHTRRLLLLHGLPATTGADTVALQQSSADQEDGLNDIPVKKKRKRPSITAEMPGTTTTVTPSTKTRSTQKKKIKSKNSSHGYKGKK